MYAKHLLTCFIKFCIYADVSKKMKSWTLEYTQVSNFKWPHQAKFWLSQERRERLVRSGSADAQSLEAATVKPVYDAMTVEVEKTKEVRTIFT